MTSLILFAILCTGVYYLLARAEITRWLWQPLDGMRVIGPLLRCPACTGFWLGLLIASWSPVDMTIPIQGHWLGCIDAFARHGLYGMVCTALGWGAMKWALDQGAVSE